MTNNFGRISDFFDQMNKYPKINIEYIIFLNKVDTVDISLTTQII